MRQLALSDDAIQAGFKLFLSLTECDLEAAGLSPLEIDDFGEVFLAFKARNEEIQQEHFFDNKEP